MSIKNHWDKKARSLLLHPEGRAALKQFGIDVEIANANQKTEEKPIVVILCPTYRAPEPQTRDSVIAMKEHTRESDLAIVYDGPPISSAVVHWSRNFLIAEQIKSGKPWTHALLIDDDMVVEPDALLRLLSHKKDIVTGLCTCRTDPPMPNIKFFEQDTGMFRQIWEWPANSLVEVGGGGTGLMLLSRHVLEQMAQAYFDCLWEQDFYGLSGARLEKIRAARLKKFDEPEKMCFWFRFLPNPDGNIEMGEDMGFCYIARKYCGIPTYCDTSVQPGHIGKYPFGIKDFLPYRDMCIDQAKAEGTYRTQSAIPEKPLERDGISILVPTRKRPERLRELVDSVKATASVMPEILCYVDEDDDSYVPGAFPEVRFFRGPRIVFSDMWNVLFRQAEGNILMLGADDVVFKTSGWDDMVERSFTDCPDKILCVHGDDGHHHSRFGVLPAVHRRWIETVGYFAAPGFGGDWIDTWLNDVANMIGRRRYVPFLAEHKHVFWGTAKPDETFIETRKRVEESNAPKIYADRLPERKRDAEKLRAVILEKVEVECSDLKSLKFPTS